MTLNEKLLGIVKKYDIDFKWIPEFVPETMTDEPMIRISLKSRTKPQLNARLYVYPEAFSVEGEYYDTLYVALCELEKRMKMKEGGNDGGTKNDK